MELARRARPLVGRADHARTFSTAVVDRRFGTGYRHLARDERTAPLAKGLWVGSGVDSGPGRRSRGACAVVRAGTNRRAAQPAACRPLLFFVSPRPLERTGCARAVSKPGGGPRRPLLVQPGHDRL